MTAPILVTGGTGTLGQHVVPLLRAAGHDVRILCRTPRENTPGIECFAVDLLDGEGIDPALEGVATVLHLAGGTKGDDHVTRNLVDAARRAGVGHLVHISVIGADTMPIGWFRTQLDAEKAVTGSGIPWTLLRAAQFHDIVLTMGRKMARMPVVPAPGGLRFQPVDSREVAARLVELALGRPAGRVADIAGPAAYPLGELLRTYLAATGRRRPLLPVRVPGKAGRAYRAGDNLALSGALVGERTWEDFLAERVGAGPWRR
ncbi:SDR family oxidoreductase [Streptomyces xanthophaeus]